MGKEERSASMITVFHGGVDIIENPRRGARIWTSALDFMSPAGYSKRKSGQEEPHDRCWEHQWSTNTLLILKV